MESTVSNSKLFATCCSVLVCVCLVIHVTDSNENVNVITEKNEGQMTKETLETATDDMKVTDDIGNIAVEEVGSNSDDREVVNAGPQGPAGDGGSVDSDTVTIMAPENTDTDNAETRTETPPATTIAEDMRLTQLDPVEVCI